ncbi:hypothetical protein FFLO_02264 [Filobasidium floriforme]|uniref:Uncharacterized protein n=2 Tax=Filobasidium floriforme TaxID=5210 RepID=A0A8K0NRG1_9TREE|nr:hypothetical protein FFLO_02264 [Filobasidium floriforme]
MYFLTLLRPQTPVEESCRFTARKMGAFFSQQGVVNQRSGHSFASYRSYHGQRLVGGHVNVFSGQYTRRALQAMLKVVTGE